MGIHINFSGNQNGGAPRWYRILFHLALMSICIILLVRTVPEQRLLVSPAFGFGIAISCVNLYKELRQIYKERAKEDDPLDGDSSHRASRFCPYCGTTLQNDFEFCDNCGKKLPK